MRNWSPWKTIFLGFMLSLLGVILPLLMVLQAIASTFFLNFLAVAFSVSGIIIGFIGMTIIVKTRRDNK